MAITKGIYTINGVNRMVMADFENESLALVLRRLGLTSVKIGCGTGQCGACTILLDGEPVRSCIKKMKNIPEFSQIETLEALGTASNLHPLQLAFIKYGSVQCGFCTPGFIMSSKGLLDVNPKPTRQDVRNWFTRHNNLCRCTGYKQIVDAVMAAAEVIRGEKPKESLLYEMEADGRIYNTNYPRPAALGKVLGVTDFGDDIGLKMPPDTMHMAVKWSDELHANILGIDTAEAEAMPGVVKVLTAKDVKGSNNIGYPVTHRRSVAKNMGQPILCDKKVSRLGDAIAIVVADNEKNARAAAKKVKVTYEKLPVYKSYLEACLPGAVTVQPDVPTPFLHQPVLKGESTAEIFKKADNKDSDIQIVEGSFHSSREPHLALEPCAVQGYYDEDGNLTINYKSQALHVHAMFLPRALGVAPDKMRMIESPTGASFGSAMGMEAPALVGVAAVAVQQPVTFTCTFEENQRMIGKRPASFSNGKLACEGNGKILALEFDIALDLGALGGMTDSLITKTPRFPLHPYNVPNVRGLVRAGLSNNAQATAYRGHGSPEAYTMAEQLIDMMARKLGIDPFEMRYRNIARPGDLTINSYPFKLYPLEEMMNKMRPDYEAALQWKEEPAAPGWKRGVGISIGGYHVSTPVDVSAVALEIGPGGIITHYNAWEDQGQGGDIGTLVHTHEALKPLGIPPEKIRLVQNDTKMCPPTGPAAGSRSHYFAGNATRDAAEKLMNAMRKEDGIYRTYEEMVAEGIPTRYEGKYTTIGMGHSNLSVDTGVGDPMPDQNFLINIARLEVEEATGKVKIDAIHGIADVGIVGNYLALDGQAYGGLSHCVGFALSEDYYDEGKKYGTPLGCGFPRCNDIPDDITYMYNETPREKGPFGSGGASECFQSASHVCILNAITDAMGVRIYELPAKPEKVKAAIEAKAADKEYAPAKYYLGQDFDEVLADIKANPAEKKRPEAAKGEPVSQGH
ncbi:MAG: molybdopterin-dependent oxidoreductase [Deltaproteobacteria bacterium]|nr:molybdopterin-dependent oxidoreductase [Deltaproteobacteria bacterium]